MRKTVKGPCTVCGKQSLYKQLCRKHWEQQLPGVPWHIANPEKHRARVVAWRVANKERARALDRLGHQRHREKRNADSREYRKNNEDRMRELGRVWSKNNPEKWKITNAARRIAKIHASANVGNTEFEKFVIGEMYDLSVRRTRSMGIPWHVDHIVPLRSKIVCGLHCSANLQVIPGIENHRKGNRTWPNMP